MENQKPHEIVNRLIEARDELRSCTALETVLRNRISQLPEDNYCRSDIESLQLGAGCAHLTYLGKYIIETAQFGSEHTMTILQVYFATRPLNRYQDEQQIHEQQKMIHEAVLNHQNQPPDQIDPFEISSAAMFLEGYLMVTAFYES